MNTEPGTEKPFRLPVPAPGTPTGPKSEGPPIALGCAIIAFVAFGLLTLTFAARFGWELAGRILQ